MRSTQDNFETRLDCTPSVTRLKSYNHSSTAYLLGQAVIVLRSWHKTYVFKSNSGLNGRYFSSIDLSTLDPGVYDLSIAGGIREGYDVLKGTMHRGMYRTGYKITISKPSGE